MLVDQVLPNGKGKARQVTPCLACQNCQTSQRKASDSLPCFFSDSLFLAQFITVAFNGLLYLKALKLLALTCKSCARYSGNGECSHKTSSTCSTGRYCVKVQGKAGSNQIDVRGCAQISPYPKTTSYCTQIKSQIGNNANFGLESTKQEFDANVCFCNDRDSCNHSANARVGIFLLLLLLLISLLAYIERY